jgi:hypothetical protein
VLCFRLKLSPHNGSSQNSSMIKFLYLLLRISQSYQSVSHHLLTHPQHTPKTIQQQQGQQEQLKIKTGFS